MHSVSLIEHNVTRWRGTASVRCAMMSESLSPQRPFVYDVQCSVCTLALEIEGMDALYDVQAQHRQAYGLHHVFEFEVIGTQAK